MARPFVPVRCPSCGSGDVGPEGGQGYRCTHCETTFIPNPASPAAGTDTGEASQDRTQGGWKGLLTTAFVLLLGPAVVWLGTHQDTSASTPKVHAPKPQATRAAKPSTRVSPSWEPRLKPVLQPRPAAAATPKEPKEPEAPKVEPESGAEPEPIRAEAYQTLRGCSCKADFDGDGKAEKVQLAVKSTAVGTWITSAGTSREFAFDFIVRPPAGEPFRLELTKETAPPRRRRGEVLKLGMACQADRLLFASDSTASSWSLRTQKLEWTKTLPASYTPKASKGRSEGPAISCSRLPVKRDQLSVRLPGGAVELGVADGTESP